ncbi:MAG: tetratricopeptide repeat protein [Steroidobacteraceae bacterium]
MTAFIVGAALLALLAVLFVALPLLWQRSGSPPAAIAAMASALGLIVASVVVYSVLGSPAGIRVKPPHASAASKQVAALMRHLERMPDDLSSWLQLGEDYDSSGEYPLAMHAYDHANTVANGTNAEALAGIGEALLLGGNDQEAAKAPAYLEHALRLDPKSAKALWYSGLLAFRGGRLDVARARFATILTLTPSPPQNIRTALQKVIDQIDVKLHPPVDAATAIQLHVLLGPGMAAKVPPNASLFVFVQGPDGGAPLAVKRSSATLPQDVVLSADDAMIAQHAVRPGQKVTVVARISSAGSPLARSGDPYGQIEYVAGKTGLRYLEIDKLSP